MEPNGGELDTFYPEGGPRLTDSQNEDDEDDDADEGERPGGRLLAASRANRSMGMGGRRQDESQIRSGRHRHGRPRRPLKKLSPRTWQDGGLG